MEVNHHKEIEGASHTLNCFCLITYLIGLPQDHPVKQLIKD